MSASPTVMNTLLVKFHTFIPELSNGPLVRNTRWVTGGHRVLEGRRMGRVTPVQLTLRSEHPRNVCAVANNSNADRNAALCFTVCLRTGVLRSSDDTLKNRTGTVPSTSLGACSLSA